MQKVLIILIMIGFTISIQTAYGSAVMPGEMDTVYCQLCVDEHQIKKSKNTVLNLEEFDFSGIDSRKYPTWVNWQPAELHHIEAKSALDQKIENEKRTSQGYSRNDILFAALIELEENKATKKTNNEKIQNDNFYKLDNFHTIYRSSSDETIKKLNQDIQIQQQIANSVLQNMLDLRNDRY